jgi:hypothetical protein
MEDQFRKQLETEVARLSGGAPAGRPQPGKTGKAAAAASDSSLPVVMEALKQLDASRQNSEAALMAGLKLIAEKLSAPKRVVVKQPSGKSMEFSVGSDTVQ